MLGVGRDLAGPSSPTPVPKKGHLEQAAQDLVQAGLEYLQRRRSSIYHSSNIRKDKTNKHKKKGKKLKTWTAEYKVVQWQLFIVHIYRKVIPLFAYITSSQEKTANECHRPSCLRYDQ